MDGGQNFHYGIVGDGPDATIMAYGSSIAEAVPDEEQKAWACSTCTFWNTETMGRFCSMCGSRRFFGQASNANSECEPLSQSSETPAQPALNGYGGRQDTVENTLQFSPGLEDRRKFPTHQNIPYEEQLPQASLEKSFSVMGLLDDDDPNSQAALGSAVGKKTGLSARDFQMSFANWSVSDQGAWTCEACTFVNTNPLHLQCEICEQKRPSKNLQNQSQKMMQEMMETSFKTGQHDFLRRQQERIEEIEERVIVSERMQEIEELQAQMMDDFTDEKKEMLDTSHSERLSMQERAKRAEDFIDDLERIKEQEREEQRRIEILLRERRRGAGMAPIVDTQESLYRPTTHERETSHRQLYDNGSKSGPYAPKYETYGAEGRRDGSLADHRDFNRYENPGLAMQPSSRNISARDIVGGALGGGNDLGDHGLVQEHTLNPHLDRGRQMQNIPHSQLPRHVMRNGRSHEDILNGKVYKEDQSPKIGERNQILAQERLLSQWKQSSASQHAQIALIRQRQQDILDRWQGDI